MNKKAFKVLLSIVLTTLWWWAICFVLAMLSVRVISSAGVAFIILISLVICSPE